MSIDVSELLKAKLDSKVKVTFTIKPQRIDEGITLIEPLKGVVQLTKREKGILADYKVESSLQLLCDRCASYFNRIFKFHFQQRYIYNEKAPSYLFQEEQKDGFLIGRDKHLDPWLAIRQMILLTQPPKILCKKNCKGICPNCGRDLNNQKCKCKKVRKVKSL